MPKVKKPKVVEKPITYYNKFEYSDVIEAFTESDRLSESDLNLLVCSNEYQLEWSLNHSDDKILNDYLYDTHYSKMPATAPLMHRLMSYFVKQHKTQIQAKVGNYLESKKLSTEEWLCSVNGSRQGYILSVYILSIATGVHNMVHLKDNKVWCTLNNWPNTNDEILECCEKHLVYLGFGIFLCLVK